MNALQETEFNLLKIFVEICNKNNIPYFMACGSALGAVKYKGFIPWDDDIDVCLMRKDYERFLECAPSYLPKWCFLQNYNTDPAFPHSYTKLRDSRTTFIEKGVAKLKINHGVFIDVFPIDGYPEDESDILKFEKQKKFITRLIFCSLNDRSSFKIIVRNKIFRILGCKKRNAHYVKKLENLFKKFPCEGSKILCNHGNWQGKLEYAPAWHYGDGVFAVFEGLEVRIPENFDAYLTQKYGEWRKDPKESLQKSNHSVMICDTQKPYFEYLS